MNANLPVQAIAADVCVAPQLNPESMAEAARLMARCLEEQAR